MFSTPLFVVRGTLCKMRLGGSFCLREGGFRGSCKSTSKVRPSEASARTMPFSTEVTRASMYAWAGSLTQQRPPTSDEDHCVEWFILDIVSNPASYGRGACFGFGVGAARGVPRPFRLGCFWCWFLARRRGALWQRGRLRGSVALFDRWRARWALRGGSAVSSQVGSYYRFAGRKSRRVVATRALALAVRALR